MDNPYFTAGFGLMATGAVLAGARSSIVKLMSLAQQRYLTTIEVTSRDPAYRWLTAYLSSSPSIHLTTGHHHSLQSTHDGHVIRIPGPGTHYFKWQGAHWFKMERSRDVRVGAVEGGQSVENITITCMGRQSRIMHDFVENVRQIGVEERRGRLPVYTPVGSEWRLFGPPRRSRPISSVILKHGLLEHLLSDLTRFQQRQSWYTARGIPYRRGYLLHGPPGCGKSSAIQAIAGHLGYSLAVLSLSDRYITDDRLAHLMNNLPEQCMLLLEDIDTVVPSRTAGTGLSLSGLLNAIDGVVAVEERIIMMTTNKPASLDAALIRPGRIDVSVEIGVVDEAEQGERLFTRFYSSDTPELAREFGRAAIGRSPAFLQGLLIDNPDDPRGALTALLHHNTDKPSAHDAPRPHAVTVG